MGIKIGNTDISKIKIASGLTPRLPSAYQEVEWIESSGTQYINTGWTPSSNYCKTVMDATIYTGGSSWSVYYGMTNGSSAYSLHTNHSTRQLNVGSNSNKNTGISFSNGTNGIFTFEANNGSISVDIAGSTYTGSYSGSVSQSTRPFYIFAFDENGSITWKAKMRVNSFKIYSDADTLVRDFIPCYRIADGVIGLYDLVNDVFYTNAGSGTFSKGADVNLPYKEIKKVYLGSTQVRPKGWQPGANTIAYYPLESDANDYLGNYDGTLSSPISYSTVGGSLINTAYFGGPRMTTSLTTLPNTINFWLCKSSSGNDVNGWKQYLGFNNADGGGAICIRGTNASLSNGHFYMQVGSTNTEYTYGAYTDTRVNICATTDGTTRKLYINGIEALSVPGGFGTAQTGFWLGLSPYDSTQYATFGYYSHVILESITWTAQEIADYFNQTKGDYGIS